MKTIFTNFLLLSKLHSRNYHSIELFNEAYYNFEINHAKVVLNNNLNNSFLMELNHFFDLSEDQFVKKIKNCFSPGASPPTPTLEKVGVGHFEWAGVAGVGGLAPLHIDWTTLNAVTPIKNQGQCGSCWSFSATGAIEGAYAIKTGDLLSFSEQQLIDCSSEYGNQGCNGGEMNNAFQYAIDNGICLENDYPYKAIDQTCSAVASCNKIKISRFVDVTKNNQLALKQAVAKGPVSVGIEADTKIFQFYKSGIVSSITCGTNLDHGVTLVGYGENNDVKYWKIKNSWGEQWGDKGYMKIERSDSENDKGICGIAMSASYPIID